MTIYLKDKAEIDLKEKKVNLCREGTYQYLASELGIRDRQPNDIVIVYRNNNSLQQVCDRINEYGTVPILINHPKDFVDLKDDKNYKRGGVGNTEIKDINGVKVVAGELIAITDGNEITKGTEVSLGYTAEIIPSENPLYDYSLDIKDVNHLAIVEKGRAGSLCSIQDGINYKQLILDKLKRKKEMLDNEKLKDTEAVAEGNLVVDNATQEPAVAEEPTIEEVKTETIENNEPETELEEGKVEDAEPTIEETKEETIVEEVKDSVEIVDAEKIFNDGYSKAELEYKNAIELSKAGIIDIKELADNQPVELIDAALEKIYNKKITDNKQAYIDLAVAQLNKKTWDLSDTKLKLPVEKQENLQGIFIKNKLG